VSASPRRHRPDHGRARVVIASIDTYLKYAEAVGITSTVARPALGEGAGVGAAVAPATTT
jgi:hypothetical protein